MIPVLINDVPVDCINHAAVRYHVPAELILAVIKVEGGRNGSVSTNKNGSVDYGVMQINSLWLTQLKPYGYSAQDLQFNACKNVEAGTWILSQALSSGDSVRQGIGNYHSHTPQLNQKYHLRVTQLLDKIHSTIGENESV